MDFSEALKIVKEGRGIRRGLTETNDSKFIYLDKPLEHFTGKVCEPHLTAIVYKVNEIDGTGETHTVVWLPTNEDLLADDWVEHFGHD